MVILFNIPEGTGMLGKSLLILQEYYPLFWYGVKITLLLSMLGTIFGLVLGLILAVPDLLL